MSFLRLAILMLVLAPAAQAASPVAPILCAPSGEMRQKLTRQFGAEQIATGIRDRESVMEVWNSDSTQSWTMVVTYADGNSCIVAMGHDWFDLTPSAAKDPA